MRDFETLKVIYAEKEAAYDRLTSAYGEALAAANAIKAMCDEAMEDKFKVGEELLEALRAEA